MIPRSLTLSVTGGLRSASLTDVAEWFQEMVETGQRHTRRAASKLEALTVRGVGGSAPNPGDSAIADATNEFVAGSLVALTYMKDAGVADEIWAVNISRTNGVDGTPVVDFGVLANDEHLHNGIVVQETFVGILRKAPTALFRPYGFVTDDFTRFSLSPYERFGGIQANAYVALGTEFVRGYYWSNLLNDRHVAIIGDAIDDLPGHVEFIDTGALHTNPDDAFAINAEQLLATRAVLAPLLPPTRRQGSPLLPNYRLVEASS